jgi:FkbM family methyltransferase
LFKEIFVGEEYHFQATSPAPVIIDAGANIGMASLYFRKLYPQAKILAFEPDPMIFTVLKANVERNRLDIQCVNAAVDESTGTKNFFTGAECSASGSLHSHESLTGATTVQCVRMSEYVGQWVDLLKLDVEGSETAVLRELAASGKLESIGQMIVEFHPHKGQPGNNLQVCTEILSGFDRCEVHSSAGVVVIRASRRRTSP